MKGIEINLYAAELARVSVWIGEIQWMRRNGFGVSDRPILKPLDNIECRDALINADCAETAWPQADVIIGNPPFLGDKLMISVLGEAYADALRNAFADRLAAVDLVTYWFEKAFAMLENGIVKRVGFVATQSIRRGSNRSVLDKVASKAFIYDAWADEPWVVDGADVRISIVCFAADKPPTLFLDGQAVLQVNPDLTGAVFDLTEAVQLQENAGICRKALPRLGI